MPQTNHLYAIGDIHGCSTALKTLIEAIDPQLDDTIVVLGDVIDYGPDTRGAIEQLIELSARCHLILLTGNHEEMLFHALNGRDDRRYWESCGGTTTRRCYPDRGDDELIDSEHLDFLKRNCRDYHETDDFIFVHAGYDPAKPMAEQSDSKLRWDFVQPHRAVPHSSGKTAVVGHTCRADGEVVDLGFLVMIDTDPSRAGWLMALEVNSGQVIQANQRGETQRSCRAGTGAAVGRDDARDAG